MDTPKFQSFYCWHRQKHAVADKGRAAIDKNKKGQTKFALLS
jgi:hypothetical protein